MNIVIYDRENNSLIKKHISNVWLCGFLSRYIQAQVVKEFISEKKGKVLWAISPDYIQTVSYSMWEWSGYDAWYITTKGSSWYLDVERKSRVRKLLLSRYKTYR